MLKITGINREKQPSTGKPWFALIQKYVEDNGDDRPDEILIRQVANKTKNKVTIIQGIDKNAFGRYSTKM